MITPTTPSSSNPATVTLAEVKEQFTHWRATRSKLGKIPEVLWDSVRQLTKQYGYGQIASELGLSFQQLRSKLQDEYFDHQRSKRPDDDPVRTEFVAAEFPPLESIQNRVMLMKLKEETKSYLSAFLDTIFQMPVLVLDLEP